MASYDSDDSLEDELGVTTTNVTLGYASAEPTGDDISHIGGFPTWLDDQQKPAAALAKCKTCNGYMSLLLQLNADLAQHFPQDDRRLHVLCCRKKQCARKTGSIRVLREVRKAPSTRKRIGQTNGTNVGSESMRPAQDLGSALFGASQPQSQLNAANPFSQSISNSTPSNPFSSLSSTSSLAAKPPQRPVDEEPPTATFADKLKLSDTPPTIPDLKSPEQSEPWPAKSAFPKPYPSFFLDAYPEELESSTADQASTSTVNIPSSSQYDADDSTSTSKDDALTDSQVDRTFQHFSSILSQNPEQILRYDYAGPPLLYSSNDTVSSCFVLPHGKTGPVRGMPKCEHCGKKRVFECQLVPGLIFELEKDLDTGLDDGMEWGTVIIGTCEANCGDREDGKTVTFREEWPGVQWEERTARK